MSEIRVSHLFIGLVLLAVIAVPILIFAGYLAIDSFELFGFKTPKVDQNVLKKGLDQGLATASGYTPAKTPNEALEKFREAIQARKYKFAANYCTKAYAEKLERTHDAASALGDQIDRIRNFGSDKGLMTDKLTFALYRLDPFPTNFKIGETPKQEGDAKAHATYVWEPISIKNRSPQLALDPDLKAMDQTMFNNVIDIRMMQPIMFNAILNPQTSFMKVEIVKEGEEWKLNVPTNQLWDRAIDNFMEKHKTYHTGLSSFVSNMNNERYDSPGSLERGVFDKLREAKK